MDMKQGGGAGAGGPSTITMKKKIDRRIIEKNRRVKMKHLCYKLASIIPYVYSNPSKEMSSMTQQDQLEQATNYIVQLRESVQQLKEIKAAKLAMIDANKSDSGGTTLMKDSRYPFMELKDLGSCLQVLLISQSKQKSFMLCQVISVLEDEGAEVVGVNVANDGNKVYHTLHAQAKSPRVGVETSRLGGRLHDLISDVTHNFKYDDHMNYGCNTYKCT